MILLGFVVVPVAVSAFLLQAFSGTRGGFDDGGLCFCSAGCMDLLEPFWGDGIRGPCWAVLSAVGRRASLVWMLRGWRRPAPSVGRLGVLQEGSPLVCVEDVFSLEGISTVWVLLHPISISTGICSETFFLDSL